MLGELQWQFAGIASERRRLLVQPEGPVEADNLPARANRVEWGYALGGIVQPPLTARSRHATLLFCSSSAYSRQVACYAELSRHIHWLARPITSSEGPIERRCRR